MGEQSPPESATSTVASKGQVSSPSSQYLRLNVGGSLFYTTVGTLTKHDTMLRAMFSGRMETFTDPEGWIMIDRSGKHFATILDFLRDGSVPLPDSRRETMELLQEAKYYLIGELIEACELALLSWRDPADVKPICRVPLITSAKEELQLITGTSKPVVKLLINRHNNKYSYTNTSDDCILKNLELFDKLSLRFSGRVLFVKDVIGSNEICCWSFFGHGKKVSEVCCTSIVYKEDSKKHTKVDFPEARIYEETLNILLYENRTGPDMELMQATSSRGVVGGAGGSGGGAAGGSQMSSYASDEEDGGGGDQCSTLGLGSISGLGFKKESLGSSGCGGSGGASTPSSSGPSFSGLSIVGGSGGSAAGGSSAAAATAATSGGGGGGGSSLAAPKKESQLSRAFSRNKQN